MLFIYFLDDIQKSDSNFHTLTTGINILRDMYYMLHPMLHSKWKYIPGQPQTSSCTFALSLKKYHKPCPGVRNNESQNLSKNYYQCL